MQSILWLVLCVAAVNGGDERARAVVAVTSARIEAAQGPELPQTPRNGKSSDMLPMRVEMAAPDASTAKGRYVVTAYSAKNCKVYCKQAKAAWGDGDESVSIEWVEDALPEWIRAKLPQTYNFPVLVWQREDNTFSWPKESKIYSLAEIAGMCQRTKAKREQVAGAGAFAGTMHVGPQVEAMLGWWRVHIGEGVKAGAVWDAAREKSSMSLIRLGEWKPVGLYGVSGEYTLTATGALSLPMSEASLRYRLIGDRLRLYGETELDAGILDITNPPVALDAMQSAEPVGLDPVTLLTCFSVLHGVWQMLHPEFDLVLPGRIACEAVLTGDNLAITFSAAPSIHVSAWWSASLSVNRIDINPQRVKLSVTGSRWFSSKIFQIGGATTYEPEPFEDVPVIDEPTPEPTKVIGVTLLTTEQLREFARRYRGASTGVVGNDFRQHLMAPNHGFTWGQVAGLSQAECERVHSGHHNKALTTTAVVSY